MMGDVYGRAILIDFHRSFYEKFNLAIKWKIFVNLFFFLGWFKRMWSLVNCIIIEIHNVDVDGVHLRTYNDIASAKYISYVFMDLNLSINWWEACRIIIYSILFKLCISIRTFFFNWIKALNDVTSYL